MPAARGSRCAWTISSTSAAVVTRASSPRACRTRPRNPLAVVVANLDFIEHFVSTLATRVPQSEVESVQGALADTRDALARLRLVSATLHRFTPSQGLPALSFDPLTVIKGKR